MDIPPGKSIRIFLLLVCVCMACGVRAKTTVYPVRLMWYNCENLFDTVHDAGKEDTEFLPMSVRRWNGRKYWRKLHGIAQVIAACGEGRFPDLVALCEVENDSCLHALTRRSALRTAGYEYVMTSSEDARGIDVALLYRPAMFRQTESNVWRVEKHRSSSKEIPFRPTRDLLHVSGVLPNRDTLDILVCHFPSRRGGRKQSEPFRLHVARLLREKADSLVACREKPQVVIAGDFNDEPRNASLSLFQVGFEVLSPEALGKFHGKSVKGSYFYRGRWNRLDNILMNRSFVEYQRKAGYSVKAEIMDFPFLLEHNRKTLSLEPFRTYRGFRYNKGYSDHLPLCLDLHFLSRTEERQ